MGKPVRKSLPGDDSAKGTVHEPNAVHSDGSIVRLTDICAVEYAEIPLVPGRITILTGDNGVGKSSAIAAVNALAGEESSGGLTTRDQAVGGIAEGFGATIKIGRNGSNRRTGKPVCKSLADQIGIAKFVDPGIADPEAADRRRIQQLARFMRVDVSPEAVAKKLGIAVDDLSSFIDDKVWKLTDPVEIVGQIKRAIDAEALNLERNAERIRGEVSSLEQQITDIGPAVSADEAQKIRDRQTAAVHERAMLISLRDSYPSLLAGWDAADKTIAELSAIDYQKCGERMNELVAESVKRDALLKSLQEQIQTLEAEEKAADDEGKRLFAVIQNKQQNSAALDRAREAAAKRRECPTDLTISSADDEVREANQAAERLSKAESAGPLRESRAQKLKTIENTIAAAESMRARAGSIVDILAAGINAAKTPIYIGKDMRVRRRGHKRGEVFYSELSHGERLRDFLKLVLSLIEVNPSEVIVTIPQENWESLSETSRQEVADIVAETGVMMLTAQASRAGDPLEIVAKVM